jgi:tellurite resistance-related uncharacterized protein
MIVQGKVWGETSPLFNKNNVEVHLLKAKKGGYCSKHYHQFKFNKFLVIYGKLKITVWKDYGKKILQDISILGAGQECIVTPRDYHRFEVLEDTQALEIYWVELNAYDIIREDHGDMNDETETDLCREVEGFRAEPTGSWPAILRTCFHEGCIGFKCSEQ